MFGELCRQEHLGYDRHGRKYWVIAGRILIETEDDKKIILELTYLALKHIQLFKLKMESESLVNQYTNDTIALNKRCHSHIFSLNREFKWVGILMAPMRTL